MKATAADVRAWLGVDDPEVVAVILATGSDDEADWVRAMGEWDLADVTPEVLDAAARDFARACDAMDAATDALREAVRTAVAGGMRKVEVARRSGVSRPTIDAWLRGNG